MDERALDLVAALLVRVVLRQWAVSRRPRESVFLFGLIQPQTATRAQACSTNPRHGDAGLVAGWCLPEVVALLVDLLFALLFDWADEFAKVEGWAAAVCSRDAVSAQARTEVSRCSVGGCMIGPINLLTD